MRNSSGIGNRLVRQAMKTLADRLPAQWSVTQAAPRLARGASGQGAPDAVVEVRGPDGQRTRLVVEAKARLTAAEAVALAPRLEEATQQQRAAGSLVVTSYLSPLARERLAARGVSYLDLTGNVRIAVERPALFIDARGAERDPAPLGRGVRSLKGGAAARVVRALCDWRPPVGVRELAGRANTDAGHVTRVLRLLANEDLIGRGGRGTITTVKWTDLLRRWTQDYQVTRTNRVLPVLDPRGVEAFFTRLGRSDLRSAVTGARAVPRAASTVPVRTVSVYVDDAERAAGELQLRRVEKGANILLLEPFDEVVWARTRQEDNLILVSVSQCAVDLLTGTGREPSEGEALLSWMERREEAWRA